MTDKQVERVAKAMYEWMYRDHRGEGEQAHRWEDDIQSCATAEDRAWFESWRDQARAAIKAME